MHTLGTPRYTGQLATLVDRACEVVVEQHIESLDDVVAVAACRVFALIEAHTIAKQHRHTRGKNAGGVAVGGASELSTDTLNTARDNLHLILRQVQHIVRSIVEKWILRHTMHEQRVVEQRGVEVKTTTPLLGVVARIDRNGIIWREEVDYATAILVDTADDRVDSQYAVVVVDRLDVR